MTDERRDINFTIETTSDAEHQLDDVLLAWTAFRGPLPEPGPRRRFTIRQRARIWRTRKRQQIEQWIHDHLKNAYCDC